MSAPARPDLTALLGSRICHDLISPLGAIGNGLELLGMAGSIDGPEMALISASVANANARIRYFRIAFGAASAEQRIGRRELAEILEALWAGGRVSIVHAFDDDVARRDAKLALLVLLCMESALAGGGALRVAASRDGWALSAEGPKLKLDERLWSTLAQTQPEGEFTAGDVQFALLPAAAAQAGRVLRADLGRSAISVRF